MDEYDEYPVLSDDPDKCAAELAALPQVRCPKPRTLVQLLLDIRDAEREAEKLEREGV